MEQRPLQGKWPQETSVSGGGVSMQQSAKLAVFLASDEARWITGICLPVDAGLTSVHPGTYTPMDQQIRF